MGFNADDVTYGPFHGLLNTFMTAFIADLGRYYQKVSKDADSPYCVWVRTVFEGAGESYSWQPLAHMSRAQRSK